MTDAREHVTDAMEASAARGRTRDAISEFLRMTMRADGGEGWRDGYLAGFEGATTLVDFLAVIAVDRANFEEILRQLREELADLER